MDRRREIGYLELTKTLSRKACSSYSEVEDLRNGRTDRPFVALTVA